MPAQTKHHLERIAAVLATLALASCGGGSNGGSAGGSSGSGSSSGGGGTTFPLATMLAKLATGYAYSLSVTGTSTVGGNATTITGSATVVSSAPTGTTFEGTPAILNVLTSTTSLGASASITTVVDQYVNASYVPLGQQTVSIDGVAVSAANGDYRVVQGTPVLPATVKIGDAGQIGTYFDYADSSKSTQILTTKYSYAVVADTPPSATTAVYRITLQQYSYPAASLVFTETYGWRIDTSGNPTFLSIASQATPGSGTVDLLLTCTAGC